MPEEVIFHIGSIKTGSTHLQKICYEERDELLKHSIDYIQFQPPRLDLPRWANADMILNDCFDEKFISNIILNSPSDKVLISEEALMTRPNIWQHPVFKSMRRILVVYIRNSVDLVASWAAENALPYNFRQQSHSSGRGVVSIDEGLVTWATTYKRLLENLIKSVGDDPELKVIVRPFPPLGPGEKDLLSDFLEVIGIESSSVASFVQRSSKEAVNVGSSRKYCDAAFLISKLAQEYDVSFAYSKEMVDRISARLQSGDARKVIQTLSDTEIAVIHEQLLGPMQALHTQFALPKEILSMPQIYGTQRPPLTRIDPTEIRILFGEDFIERSRKARLSHSPEDAR